MKRIIFIISFLFVIVIGITVFYFKSIGSAENTAEKVFNTLPEDASLVFECKNEGYFFDIFKDFSLFSDLLGKKSADHLRALKSVFIEDNLLKEVFENSELYFSLHKTATNQADLLVATAFNSNKSQDFAHLLATMKSKYIVKDSSNYHYLNFNNDSRFYFAFSNDLMLGSFNEELLKNTLNNKEQNHKPAFTFKKITGNQRNKNSIANLYVNYVNLNKLLNNFSNRKNPVETANLKSFHAISALNINYQSDALMFSGTTELDDNQKEYAALLLNQKPGKNTLSNILPYDVASYLFYFVSDGKSFDTKLNELLSHRKELAKKHQQVQNISQKHSINIDKELPEVIGSEFGTVQLASRDKLGLIKSKKIDRLAFIFSAISSATNEPRVRRFDDSDLLYYYLGDPFKEFKRPLYTMIENHIIVSNDMSSLKRFLNNYETQNFLSRTDKNIYFQEYLSNQGNIFFFIHNGNSKGNIRSFLSGTSYKNMLSDDFDWKNIYGFSIQFSADKDKFFTNLFMSKIPQPTEIKQETLPLDSLLK